MVLAGVCLWALGISPLWAGKLKPRPAKGKSGIQVEWNRKTASHLMRRAGFSASLEEIDRLVDQGFEATLDQLLHPELVDDPLVDEREGRDVSPSGYPFIAGGRDNRRANLLGYRDWFVYRMTFSKRQLLEKMVFFWHDHFATSGEAVFQTTLNEDETPLIGIQHELMRRHAMGNFKDFVHDIAHDPAMLLWLDNVSNIKSHPNENWARELMELFTLGLGNYTETDIQESARAFTGWSLSFDTGEFRFIPNRHDFGQKTFLGLTGDLDGDDIIERIFEQHEAARFIARKLWEFFAYPDPSEELVDDLGNVFRDSGYEIRPLLRAIFERSEFFSPQAYYALVKSPVEMAVHFSREAGLDRTDTGDLFFMEEAGQALFAPPDVAGWPSGVLWLNTATVLSRLNFFAQKIAFRSSLYFGDELEREVYSLPYWVIDAIGRNRLTTFDDFVSHFLERFLQGEVSVDARLALESYLQKGPEGISRPFDLRNPDADVKIRGLIYLILTLPEYQKY